MPETHDRHWEYSAHIYSALQERTAPLLKGKNVQLCVTGGIAKRQCTPRSDLDLLAIFDSSNDYENEAHELREGISQLDLKHPVEFYPFAPVRDWLWMAEHSQLFCSDLLWARPVAGQKSLLQNLRRTMRRYGYDKQNQYSYFVYNLLYRERQVRNHPTDLKYMRGGLRDTDLLRWIAWRMAGARSHEPGKYLSQLASKSFVERNTVPFLASHTQRVFEEKWNAEEGGFAQSAIRPDDARRVWDITDDIKMNVLKVLAIEKGEKWLRSIRRARADDLSDVDRQKMLNSDDESLAFCALWDADNTDLLEEGLNRYRDFWLIRAAVALNSNSSPQMLDEIDALPYCDMDDIHMFTQRTRKAADDLFQKT